MDISLKLILPIIMLIAFSILLADDNAQATVSVFYKQKAPSLKALDKVKEALVPFADIYHIQYLDIEDEANLPLIESFGLPETHFPIAVVIDGKFTLQKDGRIASFVHFPDFMKGIGRHEGNWSVADLEAALRDPSLLLKTSILPELGAEESEGECE